MKIILSIFLCLSIIGILFGQSSDPDLTSWKLNTTGITGYNGLPANVQKVQYSTDYVYISCSGIPDYSIGPWPGDPNVAKEQDFVFKIPRNPKEETGTKISTPLGAIGVLINGVAIFNSEDAHSYNNQNIWHRNAVVVEASSFDSCLGHPQAQGIYHYHQNPRCVYTMDSTKHSPIIGYAFDGYPIYGPYGYANPDGSGGIKRMVSSYRLRNITKRTSLPDGTQLDSTEYGPDVSSQYPLGYFVEDFEYVDSLGDLDQYNGRFTVTPEYPNGTYAYFITIDSHDSSAYPYIIGPQYYGVVVGEDIQTGGHVTINEPVTDYNPSTGIESASVNSVKDYSLLQNYPNPFNPTTVISWQLPVRSQVVLKVYDILGRKLSTLINEVETAGIHKIEFNANNLPSGIYFDKLQVSSKVSGKKFTKVDKMILLK